MSTPKVLILTGDAGESLEVMYPYQRLKKRDTTSRSPRSARRSSTSWSTISSRAMTHIRKPGYSWDADLAFKDVNPADYAARHPRWSRPGVHPQ